MTPEGWARFQADGTSEQSTRDLTLAEEGFIHCSYAEQVEATIDRFYADLPDLVVVTLDPDLLDAEVKEEATPDGTLFPHVYGPLTARRGGRRHPPRAGVGTDDGRRQATGAGGRTAASCRSRTPRRCCSPTTGSPRREIVRYYERIAPLLVRHVPGPAGGHAPLPRRHRQGRVLPEAEGQALPRLDHHGRVDDPGRQHRVRRHRGPGHDRLPRRPGRARAPHAVQPGRRAPHARSRSWSTSTPRPPTGDRSGPPPGGCGSCSPTAATRRG